jgi:hypothetical protein
MRIEVPWVDARTYRGGSRAVKDLDSDQTIGSIRIQQGGYYGPADDDIRRRSHTRQLTLFDKYQGSFDTHEECVAFAKGVEEVLNHVVALPAKRE